MASQVFVLFFGEFKHEIRWETINVSSHSPLQLACLHAIQFSQIAIQNNLVFTDTMNFSGYCLDGYNFVHILPSSIFFSGS